jgi:hypothetical protein
MDETNIKSDDLYAIRFCKERKIEHVILKYSSTDINLLPSVISSMADTDISMC